MMNTSFKIFPFICFMLFILTWIVFNLFTITVSNFKLEMTVGNKSEKEEKKARSVDGSLILESEKNAEDGVMEIRLMTGKLFPSIITSEDNGRLGNQLCAYASLLYFQVMHGMHAVLADWQIASLAAVFKVDKLAILPTRIELPPQLSWEVVATQTPQGAFFPDTEFLENIEDYKYNRLINIGIWPNYLFLYKEVLGEIREQLVFKTELQTMVEQMLVNITRENMGMELVFVGVHCRRTDYAHQLWKLSGGNMVDSHYFDRAFDIYRSRYNLPTTRVIFIVVSDDTAWIKDNLGKHEDVIFGQDTSEGQVAEPDLPGFDLCLRAACNHSIHTYGTFGAWGSLLAGGQVIAATGMNTDLNTEEDQIYRRAAVDGWIYLDVRDVNDIKEVTYSQ